MAITYNPQTKQFHLRADKTSYIMRLFHSGYLAHVYWGKAVRDCQAARGFPRLNRAFSANPFPSDRTFSLDTLPQEYPAYGNSDFRAPAYQVQLENGSTVTDLRYKTHHIYKGKPRLNGLPATYVEHEYEAETLEIVLEDGLIGLRVTLQYTVYEKWNVITRAVVLKTTAMSD